MTTTPSLDSLIQEVVIARKYHADKAAIIAASKGAWEAANKADLDMVYNSSMSLTAAESTLRNAALETYAVTGNKQVAPGVGIRVNRQAVYSATQAALWSLSHGAIAHTFDSKSFERLALAKPEMVADFVRIEDVPTATLARDLGEAK